MLLNRLKIEIKKLRDLILRRVYISKSQENDVINRFHKLYYESYLLGGTWETTRWMGYSVRKCPLDLWIYQEILFEVKPDIIIELGTCRGGSTLFLAQVCQLVDTGKILSIDIKQRENLPKHSRIRYLIGKSTSDEIVEEIRRAIDPNDKVLVIADSDHSYHNVLDELRVFAEFVTLGSYFIVEDGNLNGHPVEPNFGPGPQEAIATFLASNNAFISDKCKEKFYMTFNPNGYLKKII